MLYGNESISHYAPSNIAVWMTMAFQAGVLNIGGFLTCHRFVSHVTGFPTFFANELSEMRYDEAFGMLLGPLFFLLGSMLSGQLVDIRLKLHKKPKYYISFAVIFVLNLTVLLGGLLGFFGEFGEMYYQFRDGVLLSLLCLACGTQNGTITSVSRSVVRTSHLTGITTDLGIGIVRYFNRNILHGDIADETRANLMRFGIIFFFAFGSVMGAFVFRHLHYMGFIVPVITSGVLFCVTLYLQVFKHRHSA